MKLICNVYECIEDFYKYSDCVCSKSICCCFNMCTLQYLTCNVHHMCAFCVQFQDIMGLVESFDRMSINLKFLKYRPDVGVREGPRAWWRYAISAVKEEEVRRKLDMWSWKHIQQHRSVSSHVTIT